MLGFLEPQNVDDMRLFEAETREKNQRLSLRMSKIYQSVVIFLFELSRACDTVVDSCNPTLQKPINANLRKEPGIVRILETTLLYMSLWINFLSLNQLEGT